jgi:hypothetical protein
MVLAIDGVDQRLKTSLEYFFEDAHDSGPRSRPLIGWCGSSSRAWVRGGATSACATKKTRPSAPIPWTLATATALSLAEAPGRVARPGRQPDKRLDGGRVTSQILWTLPRASGRSRCAKAPGHCPGLRGVLFSQHNDLVDYLDAHTERLCSALKDRIPLPLQEWARILGELGVKATT